MRDQATTGPAGGIGGFEKWLYLRVAAAIAVGVGLGAPVAATCASIGTSNFFELSGAAIATVVGVLVEAPVMLSLVAFANRTRHWFPET